MSFLKINLNDKDLFMEDGRVVSLHEPAGFEVIRKLWEYTNWANKYSYNFTWLGRPIIQLPDDILRIQEIVYKVKPTLIIETGVAHGGSLILYASLLKMLGRGRVIGVDVEIRKHNKIEIEKHEMSPIITLIEGSSTAPEIVESVRQQIKEDDVVLVILDSCHSKEHVLQELRLYSPFVTQNSYLIVADGIMQDVAGAPQAQEDWKWNNPQQAVKEFLEEDPQFANEKWSPAFRESNINALPTYYPNGFLKKISK